MKKTIVLVFVYLITVIGVQQASAQFAEGRESKIFSIGSASGEKIEFGLRSGLNFSSLSVSDEDDDEESKSRFSYNFGIVADIPIAQNIYLQPGLFLTNKGNKYTYEDEDYDYKEELTIELPYLEIPVLVSYRHNLSNNLKWSIDFGPYLAFGIGSGKVKYKETYDGESESGSIDAFGDDDDTFGLNKFDAGLRFGTGIIFGKSYIGIQYGLGMANIANEDYWGDGDDFSIKNRTFSINIGYNF